MRVHTYFLINWILHIWLTFRELFWVYGIISREICNLLKLSPLTGWFVLSAIQVVLTLGFVLACLIKKGQRPSAQTQVWQKSRRFCHVYLWSATQNKTLVLLYHFQKNIIFGINNTPILCIGKILILSNN